MSHSERKQDASMTQNLQNSDLKIPSVRVAGLAIGVGLAVAAAALWFNWAAKERSLQLRARDRLR